MASSINDLSIGQFVTFSSKLPSDQNVYHGKVLSIMTYEEAVKYGDVVSYNNNLKNQLGEDEYPYDWTEIMYFLLQRHTYADNQPQDKVIFAKEWIDENTFVIDDDYKKAYIVVFGVTDSTVTNILDSIRNMGYQAVLDTMK